MLIKKEGSVDRMKILENSSIVNDNDSLPIIKNLKCLIAMQSKLLVPCEFKFKGVAGFGTQT